MYYNVAMYYGIYFIIKMCNLINYLKTLKYNIIVAEKLTELLDRALCSKLYYNNKIRLK